jgi:hypothetical protein
MASEADPIRCLEVSFRISDDLCVAWMIDRFNCDDGAHQLGIVVVSLTSSVFALAGPTIRIAPAYRPDPRYRDRFR